MATEVMAQLHHTAHCSQHAITERYGADLDVHLTEREFMEVLIADGYSPRVYCSDDAITPADAAGARTVLKKQMLDVVQIAIESHIPPVLCLAPREDAAPRHAVAVVGHTSSDSERSEGPWVEYDYGHEELNTQPVLSSSSWLSGLIVHDDSVGPFLRLPIAEPRKDPRRGKKAIPPTEYEWVWGQSVEQHLESVTLPLPEGVRLDPEVVGRTAARSLANIAKVESLARTGSASWRKYHTLRRIVDAIMEPMAKSGRVVLNTYLDHGDGFRVRTCKFLVLASTRSSQSRRLAEHQILSNIILPRHVYVVSILLQGMVDNLGLADAPVLGYLLLDASATASSTRVLLAARVGESFIYIDSISGEQETVYAPYCPRTQRQIHS